jgi:hypothetical protein
MKKYASYILIIATLVGLFGLGVGAQAQTPPQYGTCKIPRTILGGFNTFVRVTSQTCIDNGGAKDGSNWTLDTTTPPTETYQDCTARIASGANTDAGVDTSSCNNLQGAPPQKGNTDFENAVIGDGCGAILTGTIPGCFKQLFYYVIYLPSSFILWVAAKFFNALISISLDSALFAKSTFIPIAWAVVRDLSNIFFILILLYVAIRTILGLGEHGVKKTIAYIVIAALLINFSMFFSEVIIDTSNVLALIFYNKLDVNTNVKNADGTKGERPYDPSTVGERDLSGAVYYSFDPTSKLNNQNFFDKIRKQTGVTNVPAGEIIGIILISVAVMLYASYCFFIVGLAFLSRLIELWILIIFSPFAFMSWSVPALSKIESIGWDEWFSRLLKLSFMAPIFMFFLYLIFLLLGTNLFGNIITQGANQTTMQTILLVIIPALVILIILKKATERAKKASGELGAAIMTGAKVVGGLALGAVTGGAALAATGGLGGLASKVASSKGLQEVAKEKTFGGAIARLGLKTADYGTRASFDVRKIPGVGALAKAGGINIESAGAIGLGSKEGGYEKRRADKVKKRQERANQLGVREDEGLKQNLNAVERDLQGLLVTNSHELEQLDKRIKVARENASDAASASRAASPTDADYAAKQARAKVTADLVVNLRGERSALKDGSTTFTRSTARVLAGESTTAVFTNNRTAATAAHPLGRSINDLEDHDIPDAHHAVEAETKSRQRDYADRIENKWFWGRSNREAAQKIRMGAKLDSGEKGGH